MPYTAVLKDEKLCETVHFVSGMSQGHKVIQGDWNIIGLSNRCLASSLGSFPSSPLF